MKVSGARQKEDLKQEIMDAASELFISEGYANTSMRRIANKIGYSPTTIYLYFRDKADLLNQICEGTFAKLTRNIVAINQLSGDPLDKLRLGMKEYVLFGLAHPAHYQIVFGTKFLSDDVRSDDFSEGTKAFDTLRHAISACVSAKLLKTNDVELLSQTLWAGIHGVTSLLNNQPNFPWKARETVIDSVLDTLISGVRA